MAHGCFRPIRTLAATISFGIAITNARAGSPGFFAPLDERRHVHKPRIITYVPTGRIGLARKRPGRTLTGPRVIITGKRRRPSKPRAAYVFQCPVRYSTNQRWPTSAQP